ncbi:MAG: site-2 protease family protein [Candidatus Caldipriscus sp.]
MESLIIRLAISPFLILSLTFHEFAHAWMAYKLGDRTAKYEGRLSLNPLVHIDPIGFLMVLLVGFGWAKPVPVNPFYFKNPPLNTAMVALAGPLSNIILASLGVFAQNFINPIGLDTFVWINIYLAVFNLIPLPPLDGWRILQGIFPNLYQNYDLESKLSWVLLILIFISIISPISIIGSFLYPISSFIYFLLHSVL